MKERRWSYIFRWHNFLELVQSELLLPLPHVLPEDLLQPGDVLLVEHASLPATKPITNPFAIACHHLQRVGDDDHEGHDLLDGGHVILVPVDAAHQLCPHTSTRPDLGIERKVSDGWEERGREYFVEGVWNHVVLLADQVGDRLQQLHQVKLLLVASALVLILVPGRASVLQVGDPVVLYQEPLAALVEQVEQI